MSGSEWISSSKSNKFHRDCSKDGKQEDYSDQNSVEKERLYVGEYKNGLREGKGSMTMEDGSSYEGDWKANSRHGYGKMIWPDKRSYTGEWRDDK